MKYHRMRDTRKEGGIRMSLCITAASAREADEIFEERWQARNGRNAERPTLDVQSSETTALPIITNASLREQFMAPGALEIKRNTPVFTTKP